jgi:hypothetical protein
MEIVEGETLAEAMARGPLQVQNVLRIAGQMADALESAHEIDMSHPG